MDDNKQMIDDKSRDNESSDLKLDVSKKPSGDAAEETLAVAVAQFDPQSIEAFLKFLETDLIDPPADASGDETAGCDDEPTNGWPGYPFL
jgi:hypothetical protein